jgi:WD40-like Beta Propeller Repeat
MSGPAWSPDGRWLVVVDGEQVRLVRPDGNGSHAIYECRWDCTSGAPTWSPDGSEIAITAFRGRETACPDDHTEGEASAGSSRTAVASVLPRMAAGPKLTPRMNCGRAAARTTGLAGRMSFPMGSDTSVRPPGVLVH